MPSTIPYDPQLVLANIVSLDALNLVDQISGLQNPVDDAQDALNNLLQSRRSLDMTKTELLNLGIGTKKIDDARDNLNAAIAQAAETYADKRVEAEQQIPDLRSQISGKHVQMESPVDYVKTQIKTMPLASDSINMDVQYFSLDTNAEDATALSTNVASYVANSMGYLGSDVATKMSNTAAAQVADQTSKHSLSGTLVMTVSCTHKNASILAPFVLNVDKSIKVWNHLFPKDKIVPTSTKSMMEIASQDDPDDAEGSEGGGGKPKANKFSIISGMTFGSSFVGMVHILNTSSTTVSESMTSIVTSLQAQMDAGAWFAKASGGFGVNASIANDVKNMLSSQNINSHVTMICMGAIPSMVANEVKLGVETFSKFDPKSSLEALATIQNATNAEQDTVKQSADAARTGGQMVSMKAGEVKAALSALSEISDGANKILDINSMMTALEDYLKKAADGASGVPINYYLKDITKGMLAEMWVAKYYPGKYMAITYDDTEPKKQDPPAGP